MFSVEKQEYVGQKFIAVFNVQNTSDHCLLKNFEIRKLKLLLCFS